jgi:eukaryotic-like serine/threonine-protein kinase
MPLQPGRQLEHYEIVAAGTDVARARDLQSGREVALLPLPAGSDAATLTVDGAPYLAVPWTTGEPLRSRLGHGGLTPVRACQVAAQVASELATLHSAGLVHGGLGPDAIRIDHDGQAGLAGFGDRASGLYLAPEQIRGGDPSPHTEIFSLGAILYEMLAGTPAFRREAAVLEGDPEDLPPALPRVLRQVVARCLEKDPVRRFQSAADLAFMLGNLPLTEPPARRPRKSRDWPLAVMATACLAMAGATLLLRPSSNQPVYDITPLTSFSGSETRPALSPDGQQLAFVWAGEPPGEPGVYVKQIEGGMQPVRASAPNLRADYPCWSADGSKVAYVREDQSRVSVFIAPAAGGAERLLVQYDGSAAPIDWSADGKWIAASEADRTAESIFLISVETGAQRRVSRAPAGVQERNPAFAPDGHTLVFLRVVTALQNQLYRQKLKADGTPDGEAHLVSPRAWPARSVDWTADGHHVIIPATIGSHLQFWNVTVSNGEARRLPLEFPSDSAAQEAQISIRGGRMAVVSYNTQTDIGRLTRAASGDRWEEAAFYSSSRSDAEPQPSPDGRWLAFSSTRSGYREVWRTAPDGSDAVPLTNFKGLRVGSPRWSPDSRTIVFDGFRDGQTDVWSVPAAGGEPHRLTTEKTNEIRPSFSHDGAWIYFGSSRGGYEIWKVPSAGGTPQQVTRNGGYEAFESPDGQWLYYTKNRPAGGIFRMRPAGGPEETVITDPTLQAWTVGTDRLYFGLENPARVVEFDPAHDRRIELFAFPKDVGRWLFSTSLAVTRDGAALYHAGVRHSEADILLVENFR